MLTVGLNLAQLCHPLQAVYMYWVRALIGLMNSTVYLARAVTLGFACNTQLKTVLFHKAIAVNYTIVFTTLTHRKVISAYCYPRPSTDFRYFVTLASIT